MAYVYRGKIRDVQEAPKLPAPVVKPEPRQRPVFDPSQCGTYAGYGQHRRHNVPQCRDCLDAQVRYKREWLDKRRNHIPIQRATFDAGKCGTYSGYMAHLRYKVTPCVPCKAAHSKYMNEYRARKKAMELAAKEVA